MRNISLSGALPTLIILSLSFFVSGCGQNGADVAKLEAEKNDLKAQLAALKGDKADQPTLDDNEAQPTSEDGELEFKGKIAKSYAATSVDEPFAPYPDMDYTLTW